MWVNKALAQFVRRYGKEFFCQKDKDAPVSVYGILSPVKSRSDAPDARIQLRGITGGQLFEYWGEEGPVPGGLLFRGEEQYAVLRCEKVDLAERLLYVRALVHRKERGL